MDSISLSYTMGGMTIGIVDAEADNAAYTAGRTQSARSVSNVNCVLKTNKFFKKSR